MGLKVDISLFKKTPLHCVIEVGLENVDCLGIYFTYCFETSFLTDAVTGYLPSEES